MFLRIQIILIKYMDKWLWLLYKLSDTKKQLTKISKSIIDIIKNNDCFVKEFASDFLVTLMDQCPNNITKYDKYFIMNYFNYPYFLKQIV